LSGSESIIPLVKNTGNIENDLKNSGFVISNSHKRKTIPKKRNK
jgi:hypothetical protein